MCQEYEKSQSGDSELADEQAPQITLYAEAGEREKHASDADKQSAAMALLFAAVGAVRAAGLDPELALTRASEGFTRAVAAEEQPLAEQGGFAALSEQDKQNLWRRIIMFPNGENLSL